MRTTLTVDDDVAAKLKQLAKGRTFKEAVNDALRAGLHAIENNEALSIEYRTMPVVGDPLLKNLDNVAEVLNDVENDNWR